MARIGGSTETLPQRVTRLAATMKKETALAEARELDETPALWHPLCGLSGACLVKVVLAPRQLLEFDASTEGMQRRYGVGGNVAWVATDDIAQLDLALKQLRLRGLCLLGRCRVRSYRRAAGE